MVQPPFFVIGAPRSGTTFLVEALNRHPDIFLTNELRFMTFLNRVFNRLPLSSLVLGNQREQFLNHMKQSMPETIWAFYESLGARDGMRWGDKNPHYADPKLDAECLDLIHELFPEAQFINLLRDGREVIRSLVAKGWVDFDDAIEVWQGHVVHAAEFAKRLPSEQMLTVRYEELVDHGDELISTIFEFLGLPASSEVQAFLQTQVAERTPFSWPTVSADMIGKPSTQDEATVESIEARVGSLLATLGYPLKSSS